MNWFTFKEQIPPLNKKIVVARETFLEDKFIWTMGIVSQPFLTKKMYNEKFYELLYYDHNEQKWIEKEINPSDWWLELSSPLKE